VYVDGVHGGQVAGYAYRLQVAGCGLQVGRRPGVACPGYHESRTGACRPAGPDETSAIGDMEEPPVSIPGSQTTDRP
jgi:hypothetical protein